MKRFLFWRISKSKDPKGLHFGSYWTDVVCVVLLLAALALLVTRPEERLLRKLLGVLSAALELFPIIDLFPYVFDAFLVRQQTEEEHKAYRGAINERLYGFAGGLFFALFLM